MPRSLRNHFALLLVCVAQVCLAAPTRAADEGAAAKYPAPAPPADAAALGVGVQRTMTLLATSTPQRRNRVRVLFYGQSITEQAWSKQVADDLRRRFPHADLEIENRAIGGFASQLLVRPAEHDLYPFYPDLLVFHVYGGNNEYEQIIRGVRSRTTAEVLMQTDHVAAGGAWETPAKWPPDPAEQQRDGGLWWDSVMNNHLLPGVAKKYGCGLVDVRAGWLDYLKANKLEPQALLKDGVHLNDHGDHVMAQLVGRHLVHRPDLGDDGWRGLVKTYEVGRDVKWVDGKLNLEFDGNRVDVIAASQPGVAGDGKPRPAPAAAVTIDGKRPSEFPGAYRISRPSPGPWSPLFLARVDRGDAPPQVEDWTLTVKSYAPEPGGAKIAFAPDGAAWAFELAGSVTGPDGGGRDDELFVSKSGRVKIDPAAWFRNGDPPAGYEVKWQVLPMFVDRYEAPRVEDPSREYATTLVQGIPNGKHTLELTAEGGGDPPIRAVRVYRPPVGE